MRVHMGAMCRRRYALLHAMMYAMHIAFLGCNVHRCVVVTVQATLRRNPAPDPRLDPGLVAQQAGAVSFEEGQRVLFLGRAHYGCLATVLPAASAGLSKQVCFRSPQQATCLIVHGTQTGCVYAVFVLILTIK